MTSIYCPGCSEEGVLDYSDNATDFDEWECANGECRVSVYKVPSDLTEL